MLFVSILINPMISKIEIFMMSSFRTFSILLDKSDANFALLLKKILIGRSDSSRLQNSNGS